MWHKVKWIRDNVEELVQKYQKSRPTVAHLRLDMVVSEMMQTMYKQIEWMKEVFQNDV